MIEEGGAKYVGQPLSAVIAKLGIPNDERTLAGKKVYIWSNSRIDEGTQLKCQLRIITPADRDIIESFDFDGNNSSCMRYAMALRS